MYTKVDHTLEPAVTYRTRAGNILTITSIDDGRFSVECVMHPDKYDQNIECFIHPIYIFLEWIASDRIRQVSNVQNLSTFEIIQKWRNVTFEHIDTYMW